jgi:gliding motility-associated-like protein
MKFPVKTNFNKQNNLTKQKLMKKFFTLITILAGATLSLITTKSNASHAVAADITYQYVGPNQFLLTMRYYNDCAGIPAPTNVGINYTSSCFTGGTVTLNPLPGTGLEIPPSPCLPSVISSCNGGTGYGIREYIFQGLVTLPGQCADWIFSYSLCCRNDQINTVVNPGTFSLFVSTTLDNFNFPTNSSPTFATIPVSQFCINNQFYYSQLANDIDGDSLVFSLAISETALNTSVTYAPGYTYLTPLASSTPFTIDSQTGTISFTPSVLQVGVMAVVVEEFRNGVKIGQIKRDMQMKIESTCIGTTPIFTDPVDPNGNPAPYYTANCGDTSVYIVLDQPIQCGSVVPTDIRVFTPQGQPNPVMSATPVNCINGQSDSILVTFFYPLTAGTTYAYTKVGFDNNTFLSECGVQMPEFDSIAFNVIDPGIFNTETLNTSCTFDQITVTFDYEIACNTLSGNGSEFYLVDANGINYPVTGISGCPGGNSYSSTLTFNFGTFISPATPVTLMVQTGSDANTFTNRCNTYIPNGNTLATLNVLNNLIIDLGANQVVCDVDPIPVLNAGISNATYTWYLNGVLLPDQTQTINATQNGTYTVLVSATPVCSGTDSVTVTINTSPTVTLGNDIALCSTDPIPSLDAGNAGATYQWFLNGNAITGATSQIYQPTTAGTYSVTVNTGGSCSGQDAVDIIISPNLIVAIGNDQTICSNDPYPVLDAGIPNATYEWFLGGSSLGVTTQTINTTVAGTYSVVVTTVSGCTGTDDAILTVIQAPVVSLGADTTVCYNEVVVLDAGNSGATYQWYLGGTAISGATQQTYAANQTGNYSVQVNNGGLCLANGAINITVVQQLAVNVVDVALCSSDPYPVLDAGTSGVTYSWELNGSQVGTNQTYQPSQPGNYTVTVSIGSCSATDIFTVGVASVPVVTLTNSTVCPGGTFATLNAGNPGMSYLWSTGETTQSISPSAAGTYSVVVTNSALGLTCQSSGSATLAFYNPVTVALGNDLTACDNGSTLSFDAGNSGSTYVWSYNGTVLPNQNSQTINVTIAGNYSVVVTDANGCTGSDNASLSLNTLPTVTLGDDQFVCPGEPFPTLTATSQNVSTYSWTYNGNVVGSGPTYAATDFGTYGVVITDNNGCIGADEVDVNEKPCEIEIPNVITPGNGDGKNDVFFIKNLDSNPDTKVVILNRWGKEVYSSNNYQNNWDGDDLPDGTYFYVVVVKSGKDYKGALKLINEK